MFFDIEVLRRLIERRTGARRVLVVGDLILEVYLKGHVARVSPEATVPVVHLTRREESPAGAGNVMLNLVQLGMDPTGAELTPRLADGTRGSLTKPIRILTLVDYYPPAYKAGGPIRSVSNLVERLSDEFEFWVVTRDRDLGDAVPLPGVLAGVWTRSGPGDGLPRGAVGAVPRGPSAAGEGSDAKHCLC